MLLPPAVRILSSSTCVGLRYGHTIRYSGFSWQLEYSTSLLLFATLHVFRLYGGFAFRTPTPLAPVSSFPGCFVHLRPHSSDIVWYRNLNLLSIDYVFRPRLTTDLPRADQLYSGNLRYSAWRIPTSISLLIPAFSLLNAPRLLPVPLLCPKNAPLPILSDS